MKTVTIECRTDETKVIHHLEDVVNENNEVVPCELHVNMTGEGIIIDEIENGEVVRTASLMYEEVLK